MVFLAKGETPPADFVPAMPDLLEECVPLWNAAAAVGGVTEETTDDVVDLSDYEGRRLWIGDAETGYGVHQDGAATDAAAVHLDANGNELGEVDHVEMLKKNLEANGFFLGESEEHAQEHRKLWSGNSNPSLKQHWEVTQAAYGGGSAPSGWTIWTTCEVDNAIAKFVYDYPSMSIAFAGTSGMTDFGDW